MAENYKQIVRQMGITYLFNIIIFITSPFLAYLLTRHLSVAEFGAYSLFSVTISFLTVVLDLGLVHYILTKLSGKPESMAARGFYSIITLFSLAMLVLVAVIKLLGLDRIFLGFLGLQEYGQVFNIILVVIFFSLVFRVFNSYTLSRKEVGFSSMMGFANISLWVYFLVIYLIFSEVMSIKEVFAIWAGGAILSVIIYMIKEREGLIAFFRRGKIYTDEVKLALTFGLPLIMFQMGDWLIQVADRYILKHYASLETVGVYNLGYTMVGFVIAIGNVVATVMYPYYSSSHSREQSMSYFNIAVKYMLMLVLPALVGLLMMRGAIITLISGPAYMESANIIPWLIVFPVFGVLNILLYQTLMLQGRTKLIGLVYLLAGLLNISLNMWLVPIMGMKGAAISTTLSYISVFIVMTISARRNISIDWKFLNLKWIMLATAIMGGVVLFMNPVNAVSKVLTILVGCMTYGIILLITGAIGKEEISVLTSAIKRGTR